MFDEPRKVALGGRTKHAQTKAELLAQSRNRRQQRAVDTRQPRAATTIQRHARGTCARARLAPRLAELHEAALLSGVREHSTSSMLKNATSFGFDAHATCCARAAYATEPLARARTHEARVGAFDASVVTP